MMTGGTTAIGTSGGTGAFDFSASPTYGSTALSAGFSPDPYRVQVVAGGGVDAAAVIGSPCMGFAASAPDYRLFYTTGQYRLRFFASSSGDTTLIINAPDGRWYCDDDSGGNLNPLLDFSSPLSGQYDIWIGAFQTGAGQSANLVITETDLRP
ncbi:MAG: peptidase S1 [Anaerolineae bacterium]|nr:peptidase S1 [Anaerolineae bacterium]